jgi:competence ComEA-like helix-hairpin-helix protein
MADTVNVNTAQTDELTNLPGIGPAMADRIAANRPYKEIEDLCQVSGIGPAFLERLKPFVTVSEVNIVEDEDPIIYLAPETASQADGEEFPADSESDEIYPEWDDSQPEMEPSIEGAIPIEKAIIPVIEPDKSKNGFSKELKPITMGQVFLVAAISSLTAFVLAVLLSLGIIGSLNGGLRYASTQQIRDLSLQAENLGLEISVLNTDIEGIRARLDNLESISGKMGELESEILQLSLDMGMMDDLVQGMDEQIIEIAENSERFQLFIDGLGELLSSIFEQTQEVP